MTPEEASEKWCPFARVALANKVDGDGAFYFDGRMAPITAFNRLTSPGNNSGTLPRQSCCIADKCMAWREISIFERSARAPDDGRYWVLADKPITQDGFSTWKHASGHCGLAGQP